MLSFRKITDQKPIPGTRTSLHNGQTITSTGNSSLDHILGGGIQIGSILLIEEDKYVTYSRVLAKYFLSEGICHNHSILLGCLDENPRELVKKLPKPIEIATTSNPNPADPNLPTNIDESENDGINEKFNDMRIAWRYKNLPKINSEQMTTTNFNHNFNLLEQIDELTIQNSDITYWNDDDNVVNRSDVNVNTKRNIDWKIYKNLKFSSFLEKFSNLVKSDKFTRFDCTIGMKKNTENPEKSILRICLPSLGSPLWYSDENFIEDFMIFLQNLKILILMSNCVCLMTIPMHLMATVNGNLPNRIRGLVDYSIELESFAGKETNPAFKEYNGLLNIKKMEALNSLSVYKPETTDLAFKLRRKKFVIEKLHLPPELQENEQQEQDDIVPSTSCGSNQKHLLEF